MADLLIVAFLAAGCIIGILLISVLKAISLSVKDMSHNLVALNEKMTAVVYRVDNHEVRLAAVEKKP